MKQQVPAALTALMLVLAIGGVLYGMRPTGRSELDTLRDIEPQTAPARAACATIVIDQLVDAFNAGDQSRLSMVLDDATAVERFVARHAAGERWTVDRVDADAGPGAIDVTILLTRWAPDLAGGRAPAKAIGVLSCVSGRIASLRIEPA